MEKGYRQKSPCASSLKDNECKEYCDWHNHYTKTSNFNEFLILMKYGLPQRKWISSSVSGTEKKLAAILHGESNLNHEDLKATPSPVPFSILCERKLDGKNKGFVGEHVGWPEPSCDGFFPTPTDQGFCMTENFNIQEVMHNGYEIYDELMEPSLQSKESSKIEGGTLWGKKTFVIGVQSQRSQELTVSTVKNNALCQIYI